MTKAKKTLTKAQMRVAIAKDAIGQIRAGQLKMQFGTYLYWTPKSLDNFSDIGQDSLVGQSAIQCRCCQVGSAAVCAMRLFNEFRVVAHDRVASVVKIMREWFPDNQILLLESAFETTETPGLWGYGSIVSKLTTRQLGRARDFQPNLRTPSDRAVAIWQNVIKNKGTFKP